MKKIIAILMVTVMCLSCMSIVCSAATTYKSPASEEQYEIGVFVEGETGGSAVVNPPVVIKGETTKITAKPDEGYEFDGWTFSGEFEWISGDENSPEIEIRPLSDVKFVAKFKGAGGANKDNGKTSPTTGYNTTVAVVAVAVTVILSGSAVVYTGKKYFEAR